MKSRLNQTISGQRQHQFFWICRITPEWREHKSTNVFQFIQYCWLNNNLYLPTVQPLCWCKFWLSSKIRTFLLKCPVKKNGQYFCRHIFLGYHCLHLKLGKASCTLYWFSNQENLWNCFWAILHIQDPHDFFRATSSR